MALNDHDKEVLQQLERIAARYEFAANYLRHAAKVSRESQQLKGVEEMVAYAFNAQQHQPQYSGGGGLAPGRYKGVIVNSYGENNDKGTGGYLAFELTPIEGPLAGQKQTDRLNMHHTNPKVVEIANKQLSAYCHVLGRFQFQQTEELHNIPFIFDIGMQKEPNPNGYTEVIAIFDINGNEPGKAGAGPQPQSGQGQPGGPPPAGVGPQGGGWGAPPAGGPPIDSNVPPPGGGQAAWGGQGQGQPQSGPPAGQPPGWGAPATGPAPGGWGAPGGAPPGQQPPPGWGPR